MAGQLMLVNPRKKRRTYKRNPLAPAVKAKRAAARKRKSAARQGRRRAVKRVRSFFTQTRKRARRAVTGFARGARKAVRRRRGRGKKQSVMSMLKNPGGFVQRTVLPAGVGAAGALVMDALYAQLPIPANIKAGPFAPLVKIATVGVLGAVVDNFAPNKKVADFAHVAVTSAITVIAYGFLKSQVQRAMPNIPLGEFVEDEDVCPIRSVTPLSYWQAGQFFPGGSDMGEYISGDYDATGMGQYIDGASALDYGVTDYGYADLVT